MTDKKDNRTSDEMRSAETANEPSHDHDKHEDHNLVSRGRTVIDKGRRGARHELTVKGRTVIEHRVED